MLEGLEGDGEGEEEEEGEEEGEEEERCLRQPRMMKRGNEKDGGRGTKREERVQTRLKKKSRSRYGTTGRRCLSRHSQTRRCSIAYLASRRCHNHTVGNEFDHLNRVPNRNFTSLLLINSTVMYSIKTTSGSLTQSSI